MTPEKRADLVRRLKETAAACVAQPETHKMGFGIADAAAEIERLAADVDKLRLAILGREDAPAASEVVSVDETIAFLKEGQEVFRGAVEFRSMIDELRAEQGDSVEILCDNEDGPCEVECYGEWTGWKRRRVQGSNVYVAVRVAAAECRKWKEGAR